VGDRDKHSSSSVEQKDLISFVLLEQLKLESDSPTKEQDNSLFSSSNPEFYSSQ